MEGKTWLALLLAVLFLIAALDSSRRFETRVGAGVFQSRHFTISYENFPRLVARYLAEGMESAYQKLVMKHGFRDGQRDWRWKGASAVDSSGSDSR